MKKAIAIIILLAAIFLGIQLISTHFKENHEVSYKIQIEDKQYEINEKYSKKQDGTYFINISNENNSFVFTFENDFNKQKNIVKDLLIEENDTGICIYPVLMKNHDSDIQCIFNNTNYSYYASKDNQLALELVSKIKENNYSLKNNNESSNKETKVSSFIVYADNILDSDTFVVWNYKGIDVIKNNKNKTFGLYSYDKYENTHGAVVGNYYVTPQYNYGTVFDFNKVNIINLDDLVKSSFTLEHTVKQDTYINGVVNNKLYYFDPDNLRQIEINPKKKSNKIVGDEKNNAIFYVNGKWENINIYDLKNGKKLFANDYSKEEKLLSYNPVEIFESDSNYYFIDSVNNFYQLNKNDLNNPVLLFNQGTIKEVKVVKNTIYFIASDTLYFYNNDNGLKKVIKNNEWNYNSNNIYGIYKKSK